MAEQFDIKDKQILYALDKNSRMPLSQIAKEVGLSRESILYRVNNYFNKGVLRNYLTVVDMGALGYTHYKVFLKLFNMSAQKEKAFITSLKNNPFVSWVGSIEGTYNLKYAIKAKSAYDLSNVLESINKDYWQYIKKQDFATIIAGKHFDRNYLLAGTNRNYSINSETYWTERKEPVFLDDLDYHILDELSNNCRKTSTEIASNLNITSETVINRIKKLEDKKVIVRYTYFPNVNKLRGVYYKVLLTFDRADSKLDQELSRYCNADPEIVYLAKTFGNWQYEIDVEVENHEGLRDLTRRLSKHFQESLVDFEPLNVYAEHKFKFFDKRIIDSL